MQDTQILFLLMGKYVHIFKSLFCICLLFPLHGQDTVSVNINSAVEDTLKVILERTGRLDLGYSLVGLNNNTAMYVVQNFNSSLDSLVFMNDGILNNKTQYRHFSSLIGKKDMKVIQQMFDQVLFRYPYLSNESRLIVGRLKPHKIAAQIYTETNFSSTVKGILGASRHKNNSVDMVGELEAHVENAWKTGGSFDLRWQRYETESQTLKIGMEESFILGSAIGGKIQFQQDLRAGLFVRTDKLGQVLYHTAKMGRWDLGYASSRVMPTSKGDSLAVPATRENSMVITHTYYSMDNRWLPRRGLSLDTQLRVGIFESNESSTIAHLTMDSEVYIPLNTTFGTKAKLSLQGSSTTLDRLPVGEKIYFGGSNLLRGYQEDIFHADWVSIFAFEGNYTQSNSRIFSFIDIGFAPIFSSGMVGYGMGYSQISRQSIISITWGLGKDDIISDGKFHIIFTNRI